MRNRALRQPVPRDLPRIMAGATIRGLARRAKYLLFDCGTGTLILHLGMSGRLWVVGDGAPPTAHDHFDLMLENGTVVRLRDPRRFGLVLWQRGDPLAHRLLTDIGPEPFSAEFDGAALHRATRNRSAAIKLVLMDSHVVAGVGNIYANEALFRAGIHPRTPREPREPARAARRSSARSAKRSSWRSARAAARCATTWRATGRRAISRTSSWSTTAPASRARAAARR